MSTDRKLTEPVLGQVDVDGLLLSADPLLMRLHLRCGGREGGPLAVPELAELCRLSRRLGMNLSRPVQASDDESRIEMWVETRLAAPEKAEALNLSIIDWKEYSHEESEKSDPSRERDFDRLEGRGAIRTDAALRIIAQQMSGEAEQDFDVIGHSLLEIYDVVPPSAHTDLLEAVAERQPIRNQRMRQKSGAERLFVLQGNPLIDKTGLFAGYRFTATPADAADRPPSSATAVKMVAAS
ncbi:hypothetical protein C8024_15280 [Sphingopyxis sp. BSNA05]|nr:hypothetical protein [Sphingopyxis sp. BSNA05]